MILEELNQKYKALSPEKRIVELYNDFEKILFTSSFGTTAAVLLHLFNKVNPRQEILFIDTTYHFPETLNYKQQLTQQLNLHVKSILPDQWKNEFTKKDKTWTKDPDMCCSINKVEPLEKIKNNYEVWVSGLMAWQTPHREELNVFEMKGTILKFHPLIDFSKEELNQYFKKNALPDHPLLAEGYSSIGCTHCTSKGEGRKGRWIDKSKDECGLHL